MSNTTPAWMTEKVSRLATERAKRERGEPADALNLLCGEAFQTLNSEMKAFPNLARWLPSTFARNLQVGAFGALSALELAAIIIADSDAQAASVVAGPDDVVEFTALKWCSLANLLRAEGDGA